MKQTSARRNVYWVAIVVLLCLICCYSHSSWATDTAGGVMIAEPIEETGFYPALLEKEVDPDHLKPTEQHEQTVTGSYVNHLTRSYSTENPGLSMKVPGGSFRIGTSYEKGHWGLGSARSGMNGLGFGQSGLGFHEICAEYGTRIITSIIKDGKYNYNLPPENFRKVTHYDYDGNLLSESCEYVGEQVYIHEGEKQAFVIRNTDEGYRWEDKYGNWRLYGGKSEDAGSGQLLASGNRRGNTEQALYDAEHRILGYADRDGNQVLWVEYQDDKISAVRDSANRRIEFTYDANGRLWKVRDVLGHETEYLYDGEDRLIKVIKPGGWESHITYTDYGDVASVLDAEGRGHYFEFDYDKTKKEYYALVRSTSGRIKEIWYDEEGDTRRIDINGTTVKTIVKDENALIITDEQGLKTRKEYDEWENLKKVIYPDESVTTYQYDRSHYHRLMSKHDRGVITEYTYNDNGKLTRAVEAEGTETERITEYTYNAEENRIKMRTIENAGSAMELVTEENYDDDGNRIRLVKAVGTEFERKTEYAYTDGNLTSIIKYLDADTTVETTMEYDTDGNLTKKIDPAGNETSYTYNEDGNLDTMTTVQGNWDYDYDSEGRLWKITDSFNNTREREYDENGNVKVLKANGKIISTYTYDDGNLIERTDAEGNVYRFDYNADGQMIGQRDPEGTLLQYEYDENGRLEKTTDGNGNEIVREYGPVGASGSGYCPSCGSTSLLGGAGGGFERLQKIIYPTFTKEFRYDEQGRISEEIYTLNGGETYSVTYTYDTFGRLQTTTDPDNMTTTYHYDIMGRRIMVEDPSGQTRFEYDNWDNLIALTNAENQRTEFEYDSLGKLKKEIRPMKEEVTYEYDNLGRLWKIIDAKNQMTEYGYDSQGRLETVSYDDGKTVTLSYDVDNNLAGYNDGETSAEYDYDDMGRKTWERVNYGSFSKEYFYTYYGNGLKQTFTAPDGTMYEYSYGNNNELREVRIPGLGAITISDYTWNRPSKMTFPGGTQRASGYDALMRLQSLLVTDPGGNPLLDYTYTYDNVGNIEIKTTQHGAYGYGYDAMSRLISTDNPVLDDESYAYDDVGNRLTDSGVTGNWNYNANNELLGFADVVYDYDANGNMTQITVAGQVVWTYVYDAANRLVHVEDGTATISADYYYDPFGRRLWKDVGGTRMYFFYSNEGLIGEYDASGNEIKTYGYKPNFFWTADPLFLKQGTDYYFYQNDHLGTPQKLLAMNGAVVWSAQYRVFGEAVIDVSTVTNNLRFPGQYYDEETGLHYNWHRYYDSRIGRYIQADLIGFGGGDVNLYGYVGNNSANWIDSLGLKPYPPHVEANMQNIFAPLIKKENSFCYQLGIDPVCCKIEEAATLKFIADENEYLDGMDWVQDKWFYLGLDVVSGSEKYWDNQYFTI